MIKVKFDGSGKMFDPEEKQPIHIARNERETLCGLPLQSSEDWGDHSEAEGSIDCPGCQNIVLFCQGLPAEEIAHIY